MCLKTEFKPGTAPRHVVQRGCDEMPCFTGEDDYLVYLDRLAEAAARHRCAIHAYALLPDHVQLLVSLDDEHRLARMMRAVGGRYVEYVRYVHQRSDPIWRQGLESTAIANEQALLAWHCRVESAPAPAPHAAGAAEYRWSSYQHHAHGSPDPVVRDHPSYLRLGATQGERQRAYQELFRRPDRAPEPVATEGAANRGIARVHRFKQGVGRLIPPAGTLAYGAAAA